MSAYLVDDDYPHVYSILTDTDYGFAYGVIDLTDEERADYDRVCREFGEWQQRLFAAPRRDWRQKQ